MQRTENSQKPLKKNKIRVFYHIVDFKIYYKATVINAV